MAERTRASVWQTLAQTRWPGFAIQGDGEWAVVETNTRAVMLLTYEANARNLYRCQPYTRQVYKLEIEQRPKVWERDDYNGPESVN